MAWVVKVTYVSGVETSQGDKQKIEWVSHFPPRKNESSHNVSKNAKNSNNGLENESYKNLELNAKVPENVICLFLKIFQLERMNPATIFPHEFLVCT